MNNHLILSRFSFGGMALLVFISCGEITRRIAEGAGNVGRQRDSLESLALDRPINPDRFEILKSIERGGDSLHLVRSFLMTGEKYSEYWLKNRSVLDSVSDYYYKNGRLSHRVFYRDGALFELLGSYTPEGGVRHDSRVKNGTGTLTLYHPISVNKMVECELKNGFKDGQFRDWYGNGNRHQEAVFKRDTAVSLDEWYLSGAPKSKLVHGAGSSYTYTAHYEDGKLMVQQIQEAAAIKREEYDNKGNLTDRKVTSQGSSTSVKCFYNDRNRLMSRGQYLNDMKHGDYEYFYDSGAKRSLEVYRGDTMVSETGWYMDGKLKMTVNYRNNAYHGWYRDYYPNGNKRIEQEYDEGTKHGRYLSYFENGNKYYEGRYENGKMKGEMKQYDNKGKLRGVKNY